MVALSNCSKKVSSWYKKRYTEKNLKIKTLEECLRCGLDELAANALPLVVDLNGARLCVWFPISVLITEQIKFQAMLEFSNDLKTSIKNFWIRDVALPSAFDCTLSILNVYESYGSDRKLVKEFYKELCILHHKNVKEAMLEKGLLS